MLIHISNILISVIVVLFFFGLSGCLLSIFIFSVCLSDPPPPLSLSLSPSLSLSLSPFLSLSLSFSLSLCLSVSVSLFLPISPSLTHTLSLVHIPISLFSVHYYFLIYMSNIWICPAEAKCIWPSHVSEPFFYPACVLSFSCVCLLVCVHTY